MALIKNKVIEEVVKKQVKFDEISTYALMKAYLDFSKLEEDRNEADALSYLLSESFKYMASKDKDFSKYLKDTLELKTDRNVLETSAPIYHEMFLKEKAE